MINWLNADFSKKVQFNKLVSSPASDEMQIVIPAGEEIKEHKSPSMIAIQVLKGEIELKVLCSMFTLKDGDMKVIDTGGVEHALKAKVDSVVRLSIYKK
ncbi:hypothetical protein BKH43_00680 [Helicobacter sp. 13S00401-1]|uniref:hypothetical protein n=1 Tax=Helicobacter sp. 13S00401-1 TaxID=1905758 RepID=UPI000BA523AE|nr:hypothetical protein [Helicobacter sp. 13S00401-1]PAF51784.1 hypothetical protein BKH43_00680 [Helicobacter sp. 13S00401-1]